MNDNHPKERYSLADLRYLMERLRDPQTGCPWDLKQDFASIAPFTLEEVYEVIDTIERKDFKHLNEELGDLLFQVVFYAQLGKEEALFDFDTLVHGIVKKLLVRHPHVFPDGTLKSSRDPAQSASEEGIKATWEALKKTERSSKGKHSLLDDIPGSIPALSRSDKLQKRAATIGFDWESPEQVFDKLQEEIVELRQAMKSEQGNEIEEELGDLFFTLVNLSRQFGLNAETALRKANRKFESRFQFIENSAEKAGQNLEELTLDEMDSYWRQAKSRLS